MRARPRRIALVKRATFSHVNASVIEALRREFPDYELDVIDVAALAGGRARHLILPLGRLCAHWEFGPWLRSGQEPMYGAGGCLIRTGFYFRTVRLMILSRLRRRRYAFTLQTQSLFDASVPGTPHFVYTDHVELACVEYPGFRGRRLFPDSWIRRESEIYRHASMVFTMSELISRYLVEQYGCAPERVACIYSGANAAPDPGGGGDGAERYARKRILFVSTQWERKGGPTLVDAFRLVLEAHPDAHLTIVGCTPNVGDLRNCTVVDRVPPSQTDRFYAEASVYCMPTTLDAVPKAILEAFAHRLPVVTTDIGSLSEVVRNGENGYLVPAYDARALAARLIDLVGDPARCRAMGERGHRVYQDRYNWGNVGRLMREHIERVVGPMR